MKAKSWLLLGGLGGLILPSCVKVDPIEVKPIHIVMDVNIRIDRELEEFFDFEKQAATQSATAPATQASGNRNQ